MFYLDTAEIRDFIYQNKNCNAPELALKLAKKKNWPKDFIINQIVGAQKAKHKLPLWYSTKNIIFPAIISLEQASSQQTAIHKASLVKGKTLLDLSGGMGVDCFFMAKNFEQIFYNEPDKELFEITVKNLKQLIIQDPSYKHKIFHFSNLTADDFLEKTNEYFDCIFVDPSRRNENKKVFRLTDSKPNICDLMPLLLEKGNILLLKTSCMMDIKSAVSELKFVQNVQVVSVNNECKELLFECKKNTSTDYSIMCVNISSNNIQKFSFNYSEEKNTTTSIGLPQQYLYDPNSSITKAGAFRIIAARFNLKKISTNTHLYTSDKLAENFPGKIYKIIATLGPNKKALANIIAEKKAMWMLRHSAFTEKELEKITGIKNSNSETVLFSTKDTHNKAIVIVCNIF